MTTAFESLLVVLAGVAASGRVRDRDINDVLIFTGSFGDWGSASDQPAAVQPAAVHPLAREVMCRSAVLIRYTAPHAADALLRTTGLAS